VGNSYAVSIPREIINFLNEQEKEMDEMINLSLDEFKRISLNF
jgi:antitoxin component of MazEF toxin-antitoxin module